MHHTIIQARVLTSKECTDQLREKERKKKKEACETGGKRNRGKERKRQEKEDRMKEVNSVIHFWSTGGPVSTYGWSGRLLFAVN